MARVGIADYITKVVTRILSLSFMVCVALATTGAASAERRPSRERMRVEDVFATSSGQYVVILRTEAEPLLYLPISVGEMEALAMRLRMERRPPPRPLTLNLLEQVMQQNNVKVTEISIDTWRDGIFVGRIRTKQNGRTVDLDARPSDAIGLAIGRGVPIFVSRQVLEEVGVDPRELEIEDEELDLDETL